MYFLYVYVSNKSFFKLFWNIVMFRKFIIVTALLLDQ